MIFPYEINNDNAVVITEKDLECKYPHCWSYLNFFKKDLVKRNINGSNPLWYQFGRSQSLTKFHNIEKIVFPVLSTAPNYIIDNTNFKFTGGGNGPYYSIISNSQYSIYYIAGLLSHPVLEAMVKSRASEFRGDYYSHGKQFIENLPLRAIDFNIPAEKKTHSEICSKVKSIIKAKVSLKGITIYSQRNIIERKLYRLYNDLFIQLNELYGLSQAELDCVTGENLFAAPIIES